MDNAVRICGARSRIGADSGFNNIKSPLVVKTGLRPLMVVATNGLLRVNNQSKPTDSLGRIRYFASNKKKKKSIHDHMQ